MKKTDKTTSTKEMINELTIALQRERADAVNLRRQHAEQMAGVKDLVKIDVVEQLLPVIDHFELALKHIPKDLIENDFVKGVNAIVKQFGKTLGDIGIERIKTVGERFDPHLHEAVSADDGAEIISEEVQAGYKLAGNVIRHAMVKMQTSASDKKKD